MVAWGRGELIFFFFLFYGGQRIGFSNNNEFTKFRNNLPPTVGCSVQDEVSPKKWNQRFNSEAVHWLKERSNRNCFLPYIQTRKYCICDSLQIWKKNRPSYFIASSSVLNKQQHYTLLRTLYYLNLTLHGSHTFSHLILITALGANIFILIFGRRKLNVENLSNSANTSSLVVELASLHFKVHLFADCLG